MSGCIGCWLVRLRGRVIWGVLYSSLVLFIWLWLCLLCHEFFSVRKGGKDRWDFLSHSRLDGWTALVLTRLTMLSHTPLEAQSWLLDWALATGAPPQFLFWVQSAERGHNHTRHHHNANTSSARMGRQTPTTDKTNGGICEKKSVYSIFAII